MALGHPEMCAWSGGLKLLIDSIVDPSVESLSESIVLTLLYLMNDAQYRELITGCLDIPRLFSDFSDIDNPIENAKDKNKGIDPQHFEKRLVLAKKALITLLKSWTGLIYLGNEKRALRSLIQALRQPIKPRVRSIIYEILGELLAVGRFSYSYFLFFFIYHLLINKNITGSCKDS
jgi:rapamycin-insensitive companion of mTOR